MSRVKAGLLIVAGFAVTAAAAGLVGSGAAIALTRAATPPPNPEIEGHTVAVASDALGETVTVRVRLPVGHAPDDGPLPVFWVTDGTHQGGHLMQTIESLSRIGLIPPAIVVEIPSTERGRSEDFLPPSDARPDTNAERFLTFVRDEVRPAVAASFALTDVDVFVGYSLGGLFASWALTEDPDAFDGWIAFSPSWWYQDLMMVDELREFASSHPDVRTFFFTSLGTREGSGMKRAFARVNDVMDQSAPPGLRWVTSETAGANHGNNPQLSAATALRAFWESRAP